MSIIIKGITKAQFYKDANKIPYMDVGWDIEELPPHGRLIDADALLENMKKVHDRWKAEGHYTPTTDDEIMTIYAQTIIEAEEEKNNG